MYTEIYLLKYPKMHIETYLINVVKMAYVVNFFLQKLLVHYFCHEIKKKKKKQKCLDRHTNVLDEMLYVVCSFVSKRLFDSEQ